MAELNEFLTVFNQKQVELADSKSKKKDIFQADNFKLAELGKLAFWNATGSGKTLLMHIHIKQYMHYAIKAKSEPNKILLVTSSEALSLQHLAEFNSSGIPATIFNKNTNAQYRTQKEVEIIEIQKISESNGDKTVAVDSFETDNLVLIDEGHGCMSGDSWKNYRDQLSETGFAFEYSATFGQAINAATGTKKTSFTQEYAKSIFV